MLCFFEESRALGIKLCQLKRELHIGKQQVLNIDDLKREVFQLQRELLQERTKVKALSEEKCIEMLFVSEL